MVLLTEIAETLKTLLNSATGFEQYLFECETQGFHIDHVYDKTTGKNFIPVFISTMGGEHNPIPNLKESTYSIPVVLYFPVRFKEDFFMLNDFIETTFIGKQINYGTYTGTCLSNISVTTYGEIQELDFKQFKEWVGNTYKMPIEVMEMWMTMTFTLYLSTVGSDFKYGNDGAVTLKYGSYTDSTVVFDDFNIQSMSEPAEQQLLDATVPESSGLVANTSYSTGLKVYYKSNTMYKAILKDWFDGKHQEMQFTLTFSFDGQTFTRDCFLMSVNGIFKKGAVVTLTLAFGKKIEEEVVNNA